MIERLQSVEVTHSDEGRSGFQITFDAGRGGPAGLLDYPLLTLPLLRPFNRVILIVTFNAMPRVLMDGIITDQQLRPATSPGAPADRHRRGRERHDGPGGAARPSTRPRTRR